MAFKRAYYSLTHLGKVYEAVEDRGEWHEWLSGQRHLLYQPGNLRTHERTKLTPQLSYYLHTHDVAHSCPTVIHVCMYT